MKIAIISNLYKPFTRGGAEIVAESMAEGLADSHQDVFVISTKPSGRQDISREGQVRIYRFRPYNLFYYLDDYKHNILSRFLWNIVDTFNLLSAYKVFKILKSEKPKIVITHNLKGLGLLTPLVIKRLKLQHIHILHDIQLANPSGLLIWGKENSYFEKGLLVKIYRTILRRFFASIKKVIFPSNWLNRYYDKYKFFQNSNRLVLRNPILNSKQQTSAKTKKQNNFLFLGHWGTHKGLLWLIEFWIKNKIPAKLIIAGKGELDMSPYSNLYNIEIVGEVAHENIQALFAKVDFLLFPSLCYENSPTVILEALKYATPVVTTKVGGAAELIKEDINGYTFEPNNERELKTIIERIQKMTVADYTKLSNNCINSEAGSSMDAYLDQLLA